MRALWNTLEKLDRAAMSTWDKVDKYVGREPIRARTEKDMKDVRTPQKAIAFEP
jgi:hypothetical protein